MLDGKSSCLHVHMEVAKTAIKLLPTPLQKHLAKGILLCHVIHRYMVNDCNVIVHTLRPRCHWTQPTIQSPTVTAFHWLHWDLHRRLPRHLQPLHPVPTWVPSQICHATKTQSSSSTVTGSSLCPNARINDTVAKAHNGAYMIKRAFVSRDTDLLVRAYLAYVRPFVEYNSVVWSPYIMQDIETIERVETIHKKSSWTS